MKIFLFLLFTLYSVQSYSVNKNATYPKSWWKKVARKNAKSWEILPQDAKKGQVILSKRTELKVFSNLAKTPFTFDGNSYQSIEALWQMMKYPDSQIRNDKRLKFNNWPFTRDQVKTLSGFESKHAGSEANKIMKLLKINWISYKSHQFNYKDLKDGTELHYTIIKNAMNEKIKQNPMLKKLLMKTKGLILLPDHKRKPKLPKSYYYEKILMDIRETLK